MFDINTAINTAIAAAVEQALIPLVTRIQALEVTVTVLETKLAEAGPAPQAPAVQVDAAAAVEALNSQEWFWEKVGRFVTENSAADPLVISKSVDHHLDVSDAFWDRINVHINKRVTDVVDSTIEAAIEDHCQTYDHDQYDEVYDEWGGESTSEFVRDDDLRGVVEEVMNNASFEVTVRL